MGWAVTPVSGFHPIRYRQSFEQICNFVLCTVSEFSCIEKRSPAGSTFLVLDVRTLWIDHAHHAATAPGAPITINFVGLLAFERIADIDVCCRVSLAQRMALSDIKPDAFTVFAPINFDALVREHFHVAFAFRTNHRNRPLIRW
jgi:hypothetical protein